MSDRARLIKWLLKLVPSNHFLTEEDHEAIVSEIGDDYSDENIERALMALFHDGEDGGR